MDGTESDFNPTMGYKPLPYGDPIAWTQSSSKMSLLSTRQTILAQRSVLFSEARQNPEAIMNSLLKSINNFGESANGRGHVYVVQSLNAS